MKCRWQLVKNEATQEHNLLLAICTFVIPRARIPTSRWATPAVTLQLIHPPTWAVEACRPRTARGRRVSWAIWRAAFGVCTTCWRARLRGTRRLQPQPPRAVPSLAQVASHRLLLCCGVEPSNHLFIKTALQQWPLSFSKQIQTGQSFDAHRRNISPNSYSEHFKP